MRRHGVKVTISYSIGHLLIITAVNEAKLNSK